MSQTTLMDGALGRITNILRPLRKEGYGWHQVQCLAIRHVREVASLPEPILRSFPEVMESFYKPVKAPACVGDGERSANVQVPIYFTRCAWWETRRSRTCSICSYPER